MNNPWKYKRKNKLEIDKVFNELRSYINRLYQEYGKNSTQEGISKIENLSTDDDFLSLCNRAARSIVIYQANSNAKTWREAARKSLQGKRVYEYLRKELNQREKFNELIDQSANFIKTLPIDISRRVVKKIGQLSLRGERSDTIANIITKYFPRASKASATLIARTQVAKTYAAITQIRAQSVGVQAYIWHTVGGPLVRDSHRHMDNVIVFYSEAPSPELLINKKSQGYYHAGNIYNCRCYQEPIIDINDLTWPKKVYYNGKIRTMSRKQFTKILK